MMITKANFAIIEDSFHLLLYHLFKQIFKQKNCKNFHAHKKKKFLFKYLPRILHIVVLVIIKVDAQIRGTKVVHNPI